MKTVKAICVSTLLALAFCAPAFADTAPGDNHSPGTPSQGYSEPGSPATTSGTSELIEGDTAVADDTSLLTIGDIFWVIASVF
jgi:hypothetical protein